MGLLSMIEYKKQELRYLMEQKEDLENQIFELEQQLEREPEKLNNHGACLNPIKFAERNCPNCHFYRACEFGHKSDYDRLKNLRVTQTK